jgi:aspartyl/glutamyl-tRNA(Asn/Gln) amidotransferase C subunit
MDITKLEKLSCLKIEEVNKESLEKSLHGIFDMMKSLEEVVIPKTTQLINYEITSLVEDKINFTNLVDKAQQVSGLNMEQGYFLAPKVIKK